MTKVYADISHDGKAIVVTFDYDKSTKSKVEKVPGARFVKRGHDEDFPKPHWRMHLGLETARNLRRYVGRSLVLSGDLKRWGKEQVQREENLKSLSGAASARLTRVPEAVPMLWDLINGRPIPGFPKKHALSKDREPRPYQTADIKLMAESNILNANGMGTGKTIEAIGSVYEAGLEDGPQLIVAPITSHLDPWVEELERYQPYPVLYGESAEERRDAIDEAASMARKGEAFWLIVGFNELRLKRGNPHSTIDIKKNKWGFDHHKKLTYPLICENEQLMEIKWHMTLIDEVHKSGLSNPRTMFARGARFLKTVKRTAMSGTPMGGKPVRLWGLFHWLDPKEFSSLWRWAETWLEIEDNEYGGKEIGAIQKGREDEFAEAHIHFMTRRTKREALPGLPLKQYIDVWVDMTETQKKQYERFEAEAEIRIEDEHLTATSVLAEYTRLKQLANARCEISTQNIRRRESGEEEVIKGLKATMDSPKLVPLLAHLDENGVRATDPEPGARAIVSSQSKDMTKMVAKWLSKKQKINVKLLTGDIAQGPERDQVIKWFKAETDDARVLCMTTQTGGVSLNLEMAGSVHILDETWNPDDQEQLEDRGDRGSRTTPLICYYYRTNGTIQRDMYERNLGKRITNRNILDFRQQRLDGNKDLIAKMEALRGIAYTGGRSR